MAKRKFELPGIQDIGKEQEAALALPKEGQHLIVGGPGTGKSVLALFRARRHHRERDGYRFLVFNHLLDRASGQLFGGGLESRTWDGWFRGVFEERAGEPVPVREPNDSGYRAIDWVGVDAIIQGLPDRETPPRPFLVIDEGQDMPPQFYAALADLGFDRFFVVADQNQQITEANSSRKEIEDRLAIDTDQVIELRHNYRNEYRVARLARAFHTDDPASPPPDLPAPAQGAVPPAERGGPATGPRQPELPAPAQGAVPLLYYYDQDHDERKLDAVAGGILRLADRDPRKLIGVIAPNNRVRERYLEKLRSIEIRLDHPPPPIRTFYKEDRGEVGFDEGGILVINAQACKGLEFDTVVLADIDEHERLIRHGDPDTARRLFYVMVARAKEQVFMFMKRGEGREIEKLLPADGDVLGRRNL